jgi:hypothetical protein
MAEPTSTRRTLRRAIAHAEHLQFFLKYGDADELALVTDSTTTSLHCTSLVQANDFWNNGWAYVLSTGGTTGTNYERKITDFTSSGDNLTLEYALASAPNNGQKIEIYDLYSPSNIHAKINEAIDRAARFFPDTVLDSTLVLEEDKLRYSLTGLTKRVHKLLRVQLGLTNNSQVGVVDSVSTSGANTLIVDSSLFGTNDQYNGYKIIFYDGTASGQVGTIDDTVAATGHVVVTTADFTVAPVAGDKFRVLDESYQTTDFKDIAFRYVDSPEYPDTLYIEGNFPQYYGYKLYLSYSSLPGALTTDASTTIVPSGIIIARARALLHEDFMNNNRADTQRHRDLAAYFHAQADAYTAQAVAQRPPIQQSFQGNLGTTNLEFDPLGFLGG